MGPLPLNIGKINRLAPAHVLAVCVVQCTSCTECELVQVVCTMDAAPIYIERMRTCMAEHMALGVIAPPSEDNVGHFFKVQKTRMMLLHVCVHVHTVCVCGHVCTYMYVCVAMCVRTCMCVWPCVYVHVCVCGHVYTYMYVCVAMCIRTCMCVWPCVYVHVCVCGHVYTYMYVCVAMCIRTCMCVWPCV